MSKPVQCPKLPTIQGLALLARNAARPVFEQSAKEAFQLLTLDMQQLAVGYAMTTAGIVLRALAEHPEPLRILAEIAMDTRTNYTAEDLAGIQEIARICENIHAPINEHRTH